MKKTIQVGMAAVLVAGVAMAQQDLVMVADMETAPVARTGPWAMVEVDMSSSHVWRGQVRNNDFVFQPQATIGYDGFSFNVASTYDIGNSWTGVSGDPSEVDLAVSYLIPFVPNGWELEVGIINYNYPANGNLKLTNPGQPNSTTELFGRGALVLWKDYFVPSVTFYGDVDEVNGTYILFDLFVPFDVSDYLQLQAGVSAGWGNTSYNDYYWNDEIDGKFNDFRAYFGTSYEVMENLSATASMAYSTVNGGAIAEGARNTYEAKEKFFVSFGVAYEF